MGFHQSNEFFGPRVITERASCLEVDINDSGSDSTIHMPSQTRHKKLPKHLPFLSKSTAAYTEHNNQSWENFQHINTKGILTIHVCFLHISSYFLVSLFNLLFVDGQMTKTPVSTTTFYFSYIHVYFRLPSKFTAALFFYSLRSLPPTLFIFFQNILQSSTKDNY